MRKKLIEAIFEFSSDEIETVEDAKEFALMSVEELVDALIDITEYFRNQVNDMDC
jgi:hypothetical protein